MCWACTLRTIPGTLLACLLLLGGGAAAICTVRGCSVGLALNSTTYSRNGSEGLHGASLIFWGPGHPRPCVVCSPLSSILGLLEPLG